MNIKLKCAVIILGIIILLLLIPKPYSKSVSSDCYPHHHFNQESGWCTGFIYPFDQEIQKEPHPDRTLLDDKDYCIEIRKGWNCIGVSFFKSFTALE